MNQTCHEDKWYGISLTKENNIQDTEDNDEGGGFNADDDDGHILNVVSRTDSPHVSLKI